MKQEYPGDIRPLLKACEELAQTRQEALVRVRHKVGALKQELDQTLDRFAEARDRSREQVQRMTSDARRRLEENRRSRSRDLARLRAGFQDAARERQSALQARLAEARDAVQASVSDIRKRTAHAKSTRFRTGSFDELKRELPATSPARPADVARPRRRMDARANEVADFLDALGPDGSLNRGS